MFQGYSFMFPLATTTLTQNRILTLTKIIESNKGKLELNENTLMIVGTGTSIELCRKQLEKFNIDFDKYKLSFINPDWISQSIQHRKLQEIQKYQLFPNPQILDVQQIEEPKQQLVFIENIGKSIPINNDLNIIYEQDDQSLDNYTPDEETKSKLLIKRLQLSKMMIREYMYLLNYEYDNELDNYHGQVDDGYEFLLDEFIMKKEEEQIPESKKFYGDEECEITEVRKVDKNILEGLDLGDSIVNLEQPLINAQMKDPHQFNPPLKRKSEFWNAKKGYFVCEAGSAHKNFNNQIIDELDKLLKIYTNEKDKGRCIAYRKAIGFIKSLDYPIKSEEDVRDMPTIGDKIKKKIVEIIQTGKLEKVQKLEGQEKNIAITQLSRVWGIGPTTASTFYLRGIKNLDDLRKNQHLLNRNQLVCLNLVEELEQRIPRDEATLIFNIVKKEIEELSGVIGLYKATACGSYRREKETCGDMDILITRSDGKSSEGFLQKLIKSLEGKLLTHHLTIPKKSENGSETYMGIGRVSNLQPHRRIDLKIYPKEQYGCAVLYFTGSDHYNRSMRLFAQKKGYTLSDHGLYPTQRGTHNKKLWKGELIPCEDEVDVYKILNLTYKEPKDRSV